MTKLRSREAYEEAIRNSLSIAQVCRYLHIKPVGGNYRTIHQAIDLYNIDTSHFTGQGWNSGERYSPVVKKFPLSRILVNPSRYNSNNLKRRLLSENIKEHRCERCGLSEWQGQKIPLLMCGFNSHYLLKYTSWGSVMETCKDHNLEKQ